MGVCYYKTLRMKNITRLSIWPKLLALGFEPVGYRAHGKIVAIGCRLLVKGGEICIEPHGYNHSDKKNYHITGPIASPYYDTFYYYEFGKKIDTIQLVESVNEYYTARQIVAIVEKMLQEKPVNETQPV